MAAKLVYGSGRPGVRGTTWFARWNLGEKTDFIEISAFGEESPVQLAGTTLHELAHALAGPFAGHDKRWKAAAARLGLLRAEAAGQCYDPSHLATPLRDAIHALAGPTDGSPFIGEIRRTSGLCSLGIGTRGGRSRGPGSGSRLRLFVCDCNPPVRVRVARDEFLATCLKCSKPFHRTQSAEHQE